MDIWKLCDEHRQILREYLSNINSYNYKEKISDVYKYVKIIDEKYYIGDNIHKSYKYIISQVIFAENNIPKNKIINIVSNYENKIDSDNFIDFLVYKCRKYLIRKHSLNFQKFNIDDIDFSNDCKVSSKYIKKICDANNVKSQILPIFPGYSYGAMLYNGDGFHFANLVWYNQKCYLIDATYSQFFYEKRNNLDRIGIMGMSGCMPGVFMLMNSIRENVAINLLQKGYIELTEERLKSYLDGFTISFRNGLYYEKTQDFSYTTEYTIDDYIKFLTGEDSQVNHEEKYCLGYQRKPLKNR